MKSILLVLLPCLLSVPWSAGVASSAAVEAIGAFAPGARILFQGDSITDGNRGRSTDSNHILGHGYVFITAVIRSWPMPGNAPCARSGRNSPERSPWRCQP
jgi:hypothetical protein